MYQNRPFEESYIFLTLNNDYYQQKRKELMPYCTSIFETRNTCGLNQPVITCLAFKLTRKVVVAIQ